MTTLVHICRPVPHEVARAQRELKSAPFYAHFQIVGMVASEIADGSDFPSLRIEFNHTGEEEEHLSGSAHDFQTWFQSQVALLNAHAQNEKISLESLIIEKKPITDSSTFKWRHTFLINNPGIIYMVARLLEGVESIPGIKKSPFCFLPPDVLVPNEKCSLFVTKVGNYFSLRAPYDDGRLFSKKPFDVIARVAEMALAFEKMKLEAPIRTREITALTVKTCELQSKLSTSQEIESEAQQKIIALEEKLRRQKVLLGAQHQALMQVSAEKRELAAALQVKQQELTQVTTIITRPASAPIPPYFPPEVRGGAYGGPVARPRPAMFSVSTASVEATRAASAPPAAAQPGSMASPWLNGPVRPRPPRRV